MATQTSPAVPFAVRAVPAVAWVLSALFTATALFHVGSIWFAPAANYEVSVAPYMPVMLPNLDVFGIHPDSVVGGGLTSGTMLIEGADPETRIYATLATIAVTALFVAVALTIARLANSLRREGGVTPMLAQSFGTLSVAVLVLGVLWQWWAQAAAYHAGFFVFGASGVSGDYPAVGEPSTEVTFAWPDAEFALTIDLWPVWAALALGAVAAVISFAERLQDETKGLV
ncbi:hypothetical protein [Microbacterium sulfonylureivorans]|uniref:hypothetical protein n=1 Tax=Microbacterium sulfonylureivorans TaxID=2486854 RepID=UPI000FD7C2B3|nr:hypothetical protein [Microbacterium sulfonylureivorans]